MVNIYVKVWKREDDQRYNQNWKKNQVSLFSHVGELQLIPLNSVLPLLPVSAFSSFNFYLLETFFDLAFFAI